MKKYLLLILFFFLLPVVFGQQDQSIERIFEQFVVREHFNTRNEFKALMNDKGREFEDVANNIIIRAFEEQDAVIDRKLKKFIFKIGLAIFGAIFFASSLWYAIFINLEKKRRSIEALKSEAQSGGVIPKKTDEYINIPVPKIERELPSFPEKSVEKSDLYSDLLRNAKDKRDLKRLKKSILKDLKFKAKQVSRF